MSTVLLWNVQTRAPKATLEGHTRWVNSVAFSPDGNTLVTADDTAKLWDVETGDLIGAQGNA
jgi:WD40 repeat protein